MGVPRFAPADVPFIDGTGAVVEPLDVDGARVAISALSMGNPHAVQLVDDVDAAPVATQGPLIERHPRFPQRVNAGYMQIVDRATIRLRVCERGAGETLACGTGACAAVVAGRRQGLLDERVRVRTRGGELTHRMGWRRLSGDDEGPRAHGVRRRMAMRRTGRRCRQLRPTTRNEQGCRWMQAQLPST